MNEHIKYLAKQAAMGKMPRREFLGKASALGLAAATANLAMSSAVKAAGPQKGGTIRVGIQGGGTTDSLDPATAANSTANMVARLWGETLLALAPDGGLEPKVAESFEASADAKTWTFKIRDGITFSNGQPVTAEDVLQTIDRHSNEETKSGALGLLRGIAGMRTDGDLFIVELEAPNADLPYLLSDYHLVIQPGGGKEDPAAVIGTGPYILKAADMGVRFVAEQNPNHWDDNIGHAGTIEAIVINDNTARVAALQSGQVDMIDRVPPRTARLVDRAPGVTVRSTSGAGHYVFIMHLNTAPFDNHDLRMALKYAINRQEMVDKILFGYGSVGNDTPINGSYPIATEFEQRDYDPDKAAFHFKKSGHSGPVTLRSSENSFPGALDAAALFQQSAVAAGITLDVKREPNDGYWSEVWNKQPFCTSYWGGRPVQDQMLSTAYLSTADWNDTRFFNERFDQIVIAARAELDEAKRKEMYAEASALIRDDGGLICPMFNDFVGATSDRIDGWVDDHKGFDLMDFRAPLKMWVAA
ncbi:ABC transporter substrate-binding protein [Ruegeria arenilitoris]|uniref:ABC transporter substrate-binding protein n=1 Tax=Ruegeria arenilitoris TaxID=1173585 RepID=UPI00147E9954|nr:ABC transporter substrate-binding protein [Ruegeria arenilitoris]